MRLDKSYHGRLRLGGVFQQGGTPLNRFTVTDSPPSNPKRGNNILSKIVYNSFPSTELYTNISYWLDEGVQNPNIPLDVLGQLGNLYRTRQEELKGNVSLGIETDKLFNPLYAKYLGYEKESQIIPKYTGELPESLKDSNKETYSLPKDHEERIYRAVVSQYNDSVEGYESNGRKNGFIEIRQENKALGTYTTWYNPDTKEVRYYDVYDLDGIPLMDKVVGKPFNIYGRIKQPKVELNPNKKQQGGTMNINKKYVGKKQLGGLSDIDWSDYNSVLSAGNNLLPNTFQQAVDQDDPNLLFSNLLQQVSQAQVTQANPLLTPQQIEEEAKRNTFLGIGKKRATKKLENQNELQTVLNSGQAAFNTFSAVHQGNQLEGLLGLLEQFQQGGKSKLGYSDGSPYAKEPHIVIPGNRVDMSKTGISLKLIPDVGKPKTVKPYSGIHTFPKATTIMEMPILQAGGKTENPKQLKGLRLVQSGTTDQQVSQYDVWKGDKLMGLYIDDAKSGQFTFHSFGKNGESIVKVAPILVDDRDTPEDGLGVWDGEKKIGYFNPKSGKKNEFLYSFSPMKYKKGGKKKNYYQEGGQGAVGAQLEKGELFVTPNLDIMQSAAKLLHKDMDKDHVTDVLGVQDYVISDLDRMKITRKQADDISFGMGGVLYEEGKVPDEPTELLASKLFRDEEDELKLSEYVERIRKTFKVTDKESVFDKKTNSANKESRLPFIAAAVGVNEKRRTGGKPETGFASTFENKFKTAISTDGNPIKKEGTYGAFPSEGEVQELQLGGPIAAGLQILSGIGQWIGAGQSFKDTRRVLQADRGQIQNLANQQSGFAGLSTAANLAGYANQSPYVESPQFDSTQLDATIRRVPRNLFDYTAGRLMAGNRSFNDAVFRNAGSFSEAANVAAQSQATSQGAIAGLGAQEVQQNINLENQFRNQKQAFSDRQISSDVNARNATRANSNQLIAGTAGTLSGGIQAQGQINTNRINALRDNDFAQLQAKLDRRGARNQAFSNVANSVGQAAIYADQTGFFQNRNSQPVQPLPPVQGAINGISPIQPMYSYLPQTVPPTSQFNPNVPWLPQPLTPQYGGVPPASGMFVWNPATGQYEVH